MSEHKELTEEFAQLTAHLHACTQVQAVADQANLLQCRHQLVQFANQYTEVPPPIVKPWTIPRIFSRGWHENFISDYLAYLLNPTINGIGEQPLITVIELSHAQIIESNLKDVNIYREYNLDGGRIDLLLEWPEELVIAIEIKIGASENPGQTTHYAQAIQRDFKSIRQHCVLLTRNGEKAKSPIFQSLSWIKLFEAFQSISIPKECHPRQHVLWEDFLEHVETYIIMSEPTHFQFSEKAALYLEYQHQIDDVRNVFQAEWGEAITFLENYLYENLTDGPWVTNFNKNKNYWHQVYKSAWNNSGLSIHYEYWMTPQMLSEGKFDFYLDIEWGQADKFFSRFDKHYPSIEEQYRKRGVQYRPPRRKQAVAWKTFQTNNTVEAIAHAFVSAFTDLRFLENEIDILLADFSF